MAHSCGALSIPSTILTNTSSLTCMSSTTGSSVTRRTNPDTFSHLSHPLQATCALRHFSLLFRPSVPRQRKSLFRTQRMLAEQIGHRDADSKRAFHNMMTHGLKQSDRLILDRPELTDRYRRKSILGRIERGADIQEVGLRDKNGSMALLYKKTDG